MNDVFDLNLRTAVYRHFANTGQSPTVDAMRDAVGTTSAQVIKDAYRRLYAKRMMVPAGDFETVQMAPPFSGVPTQHRVTVKGKEYFANCAWDAFGVVWALGGTGEVISRCEHTFEPLHLHLTPDGPAASVWRFHCVVPAAEWWNDIVLSCSLMLFFRSDEAVDEWCQARRHPRRPTTTLPQLWQMAEAWYANRLSAEARRPDSDEITRIFARIGLADPFWDPRADRF